jgi:ketosteroid isomerase-like protein
MPDESTTPDLVELARRAVEAGNRRDLDAVLSFYAPDAVWEVVSLGTRFEGVAAIRGFMDDWIGSYDEFKIDVEEIFEIGDGVTFGVLVQDGRPAGSTGHIRYRIAQINTWVDGMIVRSAGYNDIDEARAAAERLAQERG